MANQPYISTFDFLEGAISFGCDAVLSDVGDPEMYAALMDASLMINNYTNRTFWANPQTEIHEVSFFDRRIRVNMPPVGSITSLSILTTPGNWVAIPDLTVLTVDNQDNYIEIPLTTFSSANPTAPVGDSTQLPMVQIVYSSMQSPLPPDNVARATGFTAAMLLNKRYANKKIVPGIQSAEIVGEVKVMRQQAQQKISGQQTGNIALPDEAVQLLVGAGRVIPNGYNRTYYPTRRRW